jgi:hypothetical protein
MLPFARCPLLLTSHEKSSPDWTIAKTRPMLLFHWPAMLVLEAAPGSGGGAVAAGTLGCVPLMRAAEA